ncbi:MAG: VWA domain-containing protein [Bryobacteraceae bacterium]|nr:VWA domain-containing protein [Bryobacteraceae bacterium]
MFLFNLSWIEFSALFAILGGATVALYLLTRMRRRIVVSTLRFWQPAQQDLQQKRRRRIDQPWSLLLQLLALACLLLALAQPRWGSRGGAGLDHVQIVDHSAWSAARGASGTLLDESRRQSLAWLNAIPREDRVMVVEASSLATPLTGFEEDREKIRGALLGLRPAATALDLAPAFDLAAQAQRLPGIRAGEIVYAGSGRTIDPSALNAPPNLRWLEVKDKPANTALSRVELRRSFADPERWEAVVAVRNDSSAPRQTPLTAGVGGALIHSEMLALPAQGETTASFAFRAGAAGWLEVRADSRDGLAADNRLSVELPGPHRTPIAIYTPEPALWQPLVESAPHLTAKFLAPEEYGRQIEAKALIIDRFSPSSSPKLPALIVEGGARTVVGLSVSRWNTQHPATRGLRTRDLRLPAAVILTPGSVSTVLAETPPGAIALAEDTGGAPRVVRLGFPIAAPSLRFELSTPLLFANLLAWLAPDSFARQEILAVSPGAVSIELPEAFDRSRVEVLNEEGARLPFTLSGRTLNFFAAEPGTVRVRCPNLEILSSLTLASASGQSWEPPETAPRGPNAAAASTPMPRDLWRLFAVLGAILLAIEWKLYGRRLMWLKAAAVAAALLSTVWPDLAVRDSKMAVAALVDTSASMSAKDLARASAFVSELETARGRHILRVFPFARGLRNPAAIESAGGWKFANTAGEAGRATDLESALRDGAAALPAGLVPRLVVLSDGRETQGAVIRAAWQANRLGIPVDTVALDGRPAPKLRLDAVRLPALAFTGERIPVELSVTSPEAGSATLEVQAEARTLGATPVNLNQGDNQLRVTASIATPGAINLSVALRSASLGDVRFEQALSIRRPRVLYISQDAPGMEGHFISTLEAAEFEVVSNQDFATARLEDYQVVVLNNYDLQAMPASRKSDVERFIQRGGGVLVIGGEKNIWVDKKGAPLDALERALPATVAPPRSPEGASVVLIVDKSSSMEGRKMELARLAAIGVIENLRPIDQVGVLIFDNSHQWAVPMRRAEDRTLIKRLIAGIMPDGGTQIAPALAEGYKRMLTATGAYKHIVLLTDGISEEGDSLTLAKEAATQRITISTVGLGQDVNRAYLEKVAAAAKGKSYFLTDPSGLEQILIKDVMEHTGSTTVEKPLQLKTLRQAEIFEGLALQEAPPLKGYVRFEAKPTAEMLLSVPGAGGGDKDDPLFVRWQYGLGRSAVFTSDAKSRWAEAWVSWKGYDKFWSNIVRDLLPHGMPGLAQLTFDPASRRLIAVYQMPQGVESPAAAPALYALGPDGFQMPVKAERAAPGVFRASVPVGTRRGLFRVRPLEESRIFPEIGLYLPEAELTTYGSDPGLLQQIANYTGGRFNPEPRQVFDPGGRSIPSTMRLWPALLILAIALNLFEVAWRRLRQPKLTRRTASRDALPSAA